MPDRTDLTSLSKETLWVRWNEALNALCGDRKNPVLRINLDRIEDELTRRVMWETGAGTGMEKEKESEEEKK